MDSPPKKRLFLIDGYAMVYRAYFAMIRNPLMTSDGRHTSALFGFVNSVFKLLRNEDPDYLAAVFDGKEKTFRHEIYPEYKATREKMPDELRVQLDDLWKLTDAMNIPRLQMEGYEADDVIGTLAVQAKDAGMEVYIVSGDKDFMQLVDDSVFVLAPGKQSDSDMVFGKDEVMEKWGVHPGQMVDLLGLMGDTSDNVPGVKGVGLKSGVNLLKKYESLDQVIQHAEEVENKRVREGLLRDMDNAQLSKELVTLKTDLSLTVSVQELRRKPFDFDSMDEIFSDLEFYRIKDQLDTFRKNEGLDVKSGRVDKRYECVNSEGELSQMIGVLKSGDVISLDIESTSTEPMLAEIVGLSFSLAEDRGWYVPIQFQGKEASLFSESGGDLKTVLAALRPILEDSTLAKCGQNIKYDMLILKNHGIDVQGVIFDTMIAAHLLKPDARSYKLDYLTQQYLNYRSQPITELIGTGKGQISMAEVPLDKVTHYAAEDADVVYQLMPILKEELRGAGLLDFFDRVEVPLIPVLVQMERNGVYVDTDLMSQMSRWMEKKLDAFSREIFAVAGTEFNLNSPQQLAVILFDELNLPEIRKRSTNVSVLETLKNRHPLPGSVLEYRKFQKLKSTYVDVIPKLIHPETGRVHSSFNQTIAATGRLSSSNPNFQNIPIRAEEGREIRKAFQPEGKDWKLLSADYSQIELRIMA
ncbi:MAG: DNA polymerase I, partial [Candidatus Neomarinimicrobiota bacterium]